MSPRVKFFSGHRSCLTLSEKVYNAAALGWRMTLVPLFVELFAVGWFTSVLATLLDSPIYFNVAIGGPFVGSQYFLGTGFFRCQKFTRIGSRLHGISIGRDANVPFRHVVCFGYVHPNEVALAHGSTGRLQERVLDEFNHSMLMHFSIQIGRHH